MMRVIRNTLDRLRLSAKMTIMIVIALVALSAATAIGMHATLYDSAATQGAERQESNMRVAWSVLHQIGKDFRVDGDRLYVGRTLLNGDDAVVDRIRSLVGGTATIFRGDMRISTNVKKDDGTRATGTALKRGPAYDAVLGRGEPYRGMTDILGKSYFAAYDPIKDTEGRVIGVLFVGIPAADFFAQVDLVERRQLMIAVMVTLIAAGACLIAARVMFRPVAGMGEIMSALAQGRHDLSVPGTDRPDEIGDMARAVAVFRENGIAKQASDVAKARADAEQKLVVDTVSVHLSKLSNGDLTAAIDAAFPADYASLKTNFNDALGKLRHLIGAVSDSAVTIRTGSGEIAQASEDLARRTENGAAALEKTAASISEIDGRLRNSVGTATRTVERADQAIATVGDGRSVADQAVQAMGRVSDSAKGIDSVIEGLDKIAFQTRVLAMNAAVEAGRAGDAGRGFAVVADLVSALAMRAEEEAKRARDQLTVTQTDIVSAVDAVTRVDGALQAISTDVTEVHQLLASMAVDNQAQAVAINEISVAIGMMDQSTQQNAAMVEETSAAARNLASEVASLTEQACHFNVGSRDRGKYASEAPKPTYTRPEAYASPIKPLRPAAIAGNVHHDDDWTSF